MCLVVMFLIHITIATCVHCMSTTRRYTTLGVEVGQIQTDMSLIHPPHSGLQKHLGGNPDVQGDERAW